MTSRAADPRGGLQRQYRRPVCGGSRRCRQSQPTGQAARSGPASTCRPARCATQVGDRGRSPGGVVSGVKNEDGLGEKRGTTWICVISSLVDFANGNESCFFSCYNKRLKVLLFRTNENFVILNSPKGSKPIERNYLITVAPNFVFIFWHLLK